MEKIFIFIIIMIISSILSKNKKKAAAEKQKPKTTYSSNPGESIKMPKPVSDLKEMLNRLRNIDNNPHENDVVMSEENVQFEEDHSEYQNEYSETVEKSVDEKQSGKWKAPERQESKLYSENKIEIKAETNSYSIKERINRHRQLLNTTEKLKDAIIVSEILNRKYT